MIDALFSQPNYLVAQKALDGIALRHEAIARNIANLDTPGYKRADLAPSFRAELARASASANPRLIENLQPSLAPDTTAVAHGPDGNNVNLESEMVALSQNTLAHAVESQLLTNALQRMRLAITGKQ
jgi:flagellar basal-body rod protein FlgB